MQQTLKIADLKNKKIHSSFYSTVSRSHIAVEILLQFAIYLAQAQCPKTDEHSSCTDQSTASFRLISFNWPTLTYSAQFMVQLTSLALLHGYFSPRPKCTCLDRHPFNSLFSATNWVSWQTILALMKRDIWGDNGISFTMFHIKQLNFSCMSNNLPNILYF